MELTLKQSKGLDLIIERYRAGERCTVISGYAGVGKSVLARFATEAFLQLGLTEDDIAFVAYTGKAAQVLEKRGNKNAQTLHRLLYDSYLKPNGTFYHKPKLNLNYKIIFVDEVSMAPKTLMDLLFKHDVYVICCGDPEQLPPINPLEDNHLLDNPHIFLDEIMRQAQESEIIRLSMDIRAYKEINYFKGQEVQVVCKATLDEPTKQGMYLWADTIICATNDNRNQINQICRALRGFEGAPKDGDIVCCFKNYWDDVSNKGNALINGTIGVLKNSYYSFKTIPKYISKKLENKTEQLDILYAIIDVGDGEEFKCLNLDYQRLLLGKEWISNKDSYTMNKNKFGLVPHQFEYGYAITAWKAQGSEFDKVLVVKESFPRERELHKKYLYTAVTRAQNKLVLLK